MADFKNLLFPVDFSPSCDDAAPYVLAMAQRFASRITALNVLDFPRARQIGLDPPLLWPEAEIEELQRQHQQRLATFIGERLSGSDVQPMIEVGEAAQIITAAAEAQASDLVMMPTRGLGPFRRYLIGSVTAKVLHDCPCPVWTSAHTEERTDAHPFSDAAVLLCAVNLEPESVQLLQWAAHFASLWSASLRVLYVDPAVDEQSDNRGVVAVRTYLFDRAREKWESLRASAGVDAELSLAGGDASRAVAAAAQRERASLVVIARGRTKKPLGQLRGNAYAIIRESPCPVIAI